MLVLFEKVCNGIIHHQRGVCMVWYYLIVVCYLSVVLHMSLSTIERLDNELYAFAHLILQNY